ncbi:hypothetical protein OIU74_017094 [Salix koriyanagi]|uniref:U6 snRNA phosphodiesterase n=1 Tax=Salix koriyanagi TaxID=2511006 RepID=A0A9Q0SSX6_9ROSI|nr:hypothetical protein OIU74_017094 [Salix koriyanagi]
MEALRASYGDASSDSDSDLSSPSTKKSIPPLSNPKAETIALPPPPLALLTPSNPLGALDSMLNGQSSRIRSFPHVQGNYALHVYIPRISLLVPGLHVVDADVPLDILCKDDQKLEQVALGREFHISLGRTVPIRVHQIDSVVSMLRQKLQFQKGYWIDFNKWEVFVNDDKTRTFLSLEVLTGGLAEITKQIQLVNDVYKLHNLPEFYKDPRPHISLAWALGDVSDELKREVVNEMKRSGVGGSTSKRVFTCKFSGIECRIALNLPHLLCISESKEAKMQIFVKTLTGKTITLEFYKVDDSGKVQRLRKECPNAECGAGTFMANHFDRHYCGKCGLTYVYQKAGGD